MGRNVKIQSGAAVLAAAFLVAVVPARAATIDLTTAGADGTANGAYYLQVPDQSTGTGVIEPFLRIQGAPIEQGYNNDCCTNEPWDTKSGIWTHDLLVSDLVGATINGVDYYEFLLDINQTATDSILSLDEVQIFTRAGAIATAPEDLTTLGTLRFDMDSGADGDTTVILDYNLNPGSGAGDMFMYVPISFFAGALSTDNVYFYSLFGATNATNDGFEEWALVGDNIPTTTVTPTTTSVVPEPTFLTLFGIGLLAAGRKLRRRSA